MRGWSLAGVGMVVLLTAVNYVIYGLTR